MGRSLPEERLYAAPVSGSYWHAALRCLSDVRMLTFAALCIALNVILGYFRIPVGENLYILPSFVANSMLGLVCGPVVAIPYGIAKDVIGYVMYPDGGFFPGYTLTSVLGALCFSLFFFRARVTLLRALLCKLILNYGVNVLLGSCWSAMLYGKGYYYYLLKSLLKNTLLLIPETLLLALLMAAVIPAAARAGFIPKLQAESFPQKKIGGITIRILPLI